MVNTGGTISFTQRPSIASAGVIVGPVEKSSPFAEGFDEILETEKETNETYEQAASRFIEKACSMAVKKVHEKMDNIDLLIGGDLVNQMSPSNLPFLISVYFLHVRVQWRQLSLDLFY